MPCCHMAVTAVNGLKVIAITGGGKAIIGPSLPVARSQLGNIKSYFNMDLLTEVSWIYICDRACENRACGHKLHPITLLVIS